MYKFAVRVRIGGDQSFSSEAIHGLVSLMAEQPPKPQNKKQTAAFQDELRLGNVQFGGQKSLCLKSRH